jgi:hypothetical protein
MANSKLYNCYNSIQYNVKYYTILYCFQTLSSYINGRGKPSSVDSLDHNFLQNVVNSIYYNLIFTEYEDLV